MREETTFSAPVREIEVLGAGAERASTCVDALSHRPLMLCYVMLCKQGLRPNFNNSNLFSSVAKKITDVLVILVCLKQVSEILNKVNFLFYETLSKLNHQKNFKNRINFSGTISAQTFSPISLLKNMLLTNKN